MTEANQTYVTLAADIVSAYLTNNTVAASDIPALIADIHKAVVNVAEGKTEVKAEAPVPAVSSKKSVQADFLICLEDGKKFKSLKRHLRTRYDMSPEEYREKWGLAADYPMVAPAYAKQRSDLARKMGLGLMKK